MSLHMLGAATGGDTRPKDAYAQAVEAEFQQLKQAAAAAKWPADLSPKVTAIDGEWQAAKAKANAANLSVVHDVPPGGDLRTRMHDLTEELQERASGGAPESSRGWRYGVIGGGVAAIASLLWVLVRRRSKA